MHTTQFSQMPLSEGTRKAVEEMGFEEATTIQARSIPLILEGRDVIGQSQTGTGKTAAFSIPAIESIGPKDGRHVHTLILCPTRELAVQACEEIKKFTKYKKYIRAVPVYGGQSIERQFQALRQGPQIVVGTPGRIMDHMRRGTLKLDKLSMMILDEADEMLSMGFRDDIETILKDTPPERQTILFSATMSRDIIQLTRKYQRDPELIKITPEQLTVPQIEQYYFEVPYGKKAEVLSRLLDVYNPGLSMVFCNTKRQVDELVEELQIRGYTSEGLHGDMKQNERNRVMSAFKSGRCDVLVATDVAARGIDVDNIEAVFNYDIPQDMEYYVHRIGRTGRAGKEGRSYTFVCGRRQIAELREIERFTRARIIQKAVPTSSEVMETRTRTFMEEVRGVIEAGGLEEYNPILDGMMEDFTSMEISAALIRMIMSRDKKELVGELVGAFEPQPERPPFQQRPANRRTLHKRSSSRSRFESDDAGMEKIRINIGREARVSANHILGAVAGETGLPGKTFGRIEIGPDYTLVSVPSEHIALVLDSMKDTKIMGRKTKTQKA